MRQVLLLRAVNVGRSNRIAMADLRALLGRLGHTEVRTVLNSGNAVFTAQHAADLTADIEAGLGEMGLDVRAVVLSVAALREMLERLPDDVAAMSYPLVGVLLGEPSGVPAGFEPDLAVMGDGCVYLGYAADVHTSRMTTARLEKALGTGVTARTPATLLRLVSAR